MRLIDADKLKVYHGINVGANYGGLRTIVFKRDIDNAPTIDAVMVYKRDIDNAPTIDAVPVIRCKDCKHRPTGTGANHDLEFPDYVCPCQCDVYHYSWMPKDDWFCGDGERKEE